MNDKKFVQNSITQNFLYFQLSNEERESAVYYLLEAILKTRDSEPDLARSNFFDEDVNIYLAHLLFAMSLPEYHDMADPFLSKEPGEIFNWARQTEDPMLRYFIYKANADDMLVQTSIFADKLPETKRVIFRKQENGVNRLAVVYYNQASRCHRGIYQKITGIGEVLAKISSHFDLYQKLLFRIKEDYFRFIECFRNQAFQHFFLKLNLYEKQCRKDITLDQFLDAYQKWLSSKDRQAKETVLQLARELATIDPKFSFDLSKMNL